MSEIYKAITAVMQDVGVVAKDRVNQQQRFSYRGIDDVMNALHPALVKHRLFLCPEVLEHRREERATKNGGNLIYSIMTIKYTLYAQDGSSVSATVIGEGMDSADKSSNKAMAVGMKYALFQLFCIPTEEMGNDDPDKETPPDSTPANIVPMKKPNTRKERLMAFAQLHGMDMAGIESFKAALIKAGLAVDKSCKDMTDEEFEQLIAAMKSNI